MTPENHPAVFLDSLLSAIWVVGDAVSGVPCNPKTVARSLSIVMGLRVAFGDFDRRSSF